MDNLFWIPPLYVLCCNSITRLWIRIILQASTCFCWTHCWSYHSVNRWQNLSGTFKVLWILSCYTYGGGLTGVSLYRICYMKQGSLQPLGWNRGTSYPLDEMGVPSPSTHLLDKTWLSTCIVLCAWRQGPLGNLHHRDVLPFCIFKLQIYCDSETKIQLRKYENIFHQRPKMLQFCV